MHPITRFQLPVTKAFGRTVVTFPDEVDVRTASVIRDRLLVLLNNGAGPLVVDLTATRFCDCAGLRAIIRAHLRAVSLRTRVCVVLPATGSVRRIAALTGLSRRVLVLGSVTAAHEALHKEPRTVRATVPSTALLRDGEDLTYGRGRRRQVRPR